MPDTTRSGKPFSTAATAMFTQSVGVPSTRIRRSGDVLEPQAGDAASAHGRSRSPRASARATVTSPSAASASASARMPALRTPSSLVTRIRLSLQAGHGTPRQRTSIRCPAETPLTPVRTRTVIEPGGGKVDWIAQWPRARIADERRTAGPWRPARAPRQERTRPAGWPASRRCRTRRWRAARRCRAPRCTGRRRCRCRPDGARSAISAFSAPSVRPK